MNATLATAAEMMHGVLQGADRSFDGVSTDSRSIADGELFVALSGPNFDGRDFVGKALDRGAAGAVVAQSTDEDLAQITVDDTLVALGRLASAWRDTQRATVVGITGSNGKTTLKELTAACLAQAAPTLATHGNLNNEIGLPLMLTRIEAGHRYAVFEMGANHAGEIAYLASLAKPDVVAITNAGAAHLEGFGSIEGVAVAKGEILDTSRRPDCAILNADDKYFGYWASRVEDVRVLTFGLDNPADVTATDLTASADGSTFTLHLPEAAVDVQLPLAGIHNVLNACAAAAIAVAVGLAPGQVKAGLESAAPVSGRLRQLEGSNGSTLFDDSYNANPLSVVAAAEFLASLPGRNWFVLGDMFELGDDARELHRRVGADLRRAGVDRLAATGELSQAAVEAFGDQGHWFETVEELVDVIGNDIAADVNVLVKGSRGMRMERVVDALGA